MKLDILVLSAHPDDAELGCGGTMSQATSRGRQVGVVDFTRGELGSRGTVSIRDQEAEKAAKILGLAVRENMNFKDGFFFSDETHQKALIQVIRRFQPHIVLAAAPRDRHPDHARASQLIVESCFLSGLIKIESAYEGKGQDPWRPKAVYHYIQSIMLKPDFVVDVSEHWSKKIEAIKAFQSQFFNDGSEQPETYISNPRFLKMIDARGVELGHSIGVDYGEGFLTDRNLGVKDLFDLL